MEERGRGRGEGRGGGEGAGEEAGGAGEGQGWRRGGYNSYEPVNRKSKHLITFISMIQFALSSRMTKLRQITQFNFCHSYQLITDSIYIFFR